MSDGARLEPIAAALVAKFPARDDGHYYRATALLLRGQTEEAAAEARRLLTANPRHAKAQNLLGVACANAGDRECAASAFAASIHLNPHDPSAVRSTSGCFSCSRPMPRRRRSLSVRRSRSIRRRPARGTGWRAPGRRSHCHKGVASAPKLRQIVTPGPANARI